MTITVFTFTYSAITLSAPSSHETVASADDYAESVSGPWDMNECTDLGWFVWDKTSRVRWVKWLPMFPAVLTVSMWALWNGQIMYRRTEHQLRLPPSH